jgi:heme-degrading monooxygenase HmoA
MGVRVIIERKIKAGGESEVVNVLRRLRNLTSNRRGFVSGDTMRSKSDPTVFVAISLWQSLEDWEAWRDSPDRKESCGELEQFLDRPEKHNVLDFL